LSRVDDGLRTQVFMEVQDPIACFLYGENWRDGDLGRQKLSIMLVGVWGPGNEGTAESRRSGHPTHEIKRFTRIRRWIPKGPCRSFRIAGRSQLGVPSLNIIESIMVSLSKTFHPGMQQVLALNALIIKHGELVLTTFNPNLSTNELTCSFSKRCHFYFRLIFPFNSPSSNA